MRKQILAQALAVALIAVSCAEARPVASVDGHDIFEADIEAFLDGDAVSRSDFRGALTLAIINGVLGAAANEEFGIEPNSEEIDTLATQLLAPILAGGESREEILATRNITEDGLVVVVLVREFWPRAIERALAADAGVPPDDEVMLRYNALLGDLTTACTSHLVVATEAEALDALDRANAGEAFEDLAAELSIGPSGPTGGDLGCAPPSRYVPEFANTVLSAEVGTAAGPVQTEFGWHLILVREREQPAFEDVREDLITAMAADRGPDLAAAWTRRAFEAADVYVDPEYGIWAADPTPTILPPDPGP